MTDTRKNLLTASVAIAVLFAIGMGQKPEPKTFTLNLDASKFYIELEAEQMRLQEKKNILLLGSGVPQEAWRSCQVKENLVICVVPEKKP